MTSSAKSENVDLLGNAIDVAMLEAEFRKGKAKAKSDFTRARNNLLLMVDYHSLPSRSGIRDACYKMDICMEIVMDVLSSLTMFHLQNKELQKGIVVVSEMEKIETDFCAAYEIAWAYLDSREGEKSTDLSDCLSVDLEGQNSIKKNAETDTYRKQMETNQTLDKVGTLDQLNILDSNHKITNTTPTHKTLQMKNVRENPLDMSVEHRATNQCIEAEQNIVNTEKPSQNATTFVPTNDLVTANIGHDLWTQLKHVQIPTFSGDKRTYSSWKAAFMACVDIAPVTPEYKMLQLRQYVSGEALNTVENLGYSSTAYEAAKDRLERKYGGKRRHKAIFLEDLEQFRQIQSGNAEELERFADLLDMTVINLKDAGEHQDLGDGCLYILLQRKLPQSLLANYHRWLFENNVTGSVVALKTWVIQESHFQTIASETVYGLTGQTANIQSMQSSSNSKEERTFFITTTPCQPQQIQSCNICRKQHRIWECQLFLQKDVSERWNIAKRFQLCYRCLAKGHHGKSCQRTRRCGKNGCLKVHHRLLHVHQGSGCSTVFEPKSNTEQCSTDLQHRHQGTEDSSWDHNTFGMEGKRFTEQRTNIACTYFARGLKEAISCETQMPYWSSIPRKCTSLRRGTSHTFPDGLECGNPGERRTPVDAKPKWG